MGALYDIYSTFDTILQRVVDPLTERSAKSFPKSRWIYPEIPTGLDKFYPRITISFLNLEEVPISASGYICDNFNTNDAIKSKVTGKLYYVTIWIGLFVKSEISLDITKSNGNTIKAKNALLGNLLFEQIIDEIDAAKSEIAAISYSYKPFHKTYSLNYEDGTNRIINSITIRIPILSETEIIYDENNSTKLIEEIERNIIGDLE